MLSLEPASVLAETSTRHPFGPAVIVCCVATSIIRRITGVHRFDRRLYALCRGSDLMLRHDHRRMSLPLAAHRAFAIMGEGKLCHGHSCPGVQRALLPAAERLPVAACLPVAA